MATATENQYYPSLVFGSFPPTPIRIPQAAEEQRNVYPVLMYNKQDFISLYPILMLDAERAKLYSDEEDGDFGYMWKPPAYGKYRIDVHGFPDGGYGAIVRDHNGNPLLAVSSYDSPANSPPKSSLVIHLEAIQKGLEAALPYSCCKVQVRTESKHARDLIFGITCIDNDDCDAKEVNHLLEEIRKLKLQFLVCFIYATYQPTNGAARYLAQLRKTTKFTDEFPPDLLKITQSDLSTTH